MEELPRQNKARRQRMRYAERKLKEAHRRLARANRSIVYWSRIVADLRHERTRAVQPPLWPEGEIEEMK
jgi:capsule polysaccharide export protein KpsE/RkpR